MDGDFCGSCKSCLECNEKFVSVFCCVLHVLAELVRIDFRWQPSI
jgi:hypothetical protein